jgi:Cell Wall Hydrolase
MVLRAYLIGIGIAVNILLIAPVQAAIEPPESRRPEVDQSPSRRDMVAASELQCMTLAIFFEGGSTGEPEEGLRHIARVIGERAKANRREWGGPTICGVVFHRAKGVCQFSFACLPLARRTPREGPLWDISAEIARDEIEGENEGPDRSIRYYMNAELTSLRNVCRFRREFVPVIKAGRHEFFREPTASELKELSQAEFDACTRHTALLGARKAKAAEKRSARKSKAKEKYAKARTNKKTIRTKLARLKR